MSANLNRLGFLPKEAFDFASLMEKQAKPVYEEMGIVIPVITTSTLVLIQQLKVASLLDIARGLNISHQLAAQRIKSLMKLQLLYAEKDVSDKRKTNYSLTELGEAQAQLVSAYLDQADQVFAELNIEFGRDLMKLLKQVNQSFVKKTLQQRIYSEESRNENS
ncbi:hypothetical protein [Thalassotalea ganghwensis]